MLKFDIDLYVRNYVVPVYCGDMRGTAFFVDFNKLLTAWHVVSSHSLGSEVYVIVGEEKVSCKVFDIGKDVALLECNAPVLPINDKVPLLSCDFVEGLNLKIIGYPEELGNGVDCFVIDVQNKKELKHSLLDSFDTVAMRTDMLGFNSYVGFSGSPVVDEYGHALGVITDQFYNSLSYTSIHSIVDKIENFSILVEKKGDFYDTTHLGWGYCRNFLSAHIGKAGNRYERNLHVDNFEFDNAFRAFARNGYDALREDYTQQLEKLLPQIDHEDDTYDLKNTQSYNDFMENHKISYELINDLDSFYDMTEWSYKRILRKLTRKIERDLLGVEKYSDSQFVRVVAKAGSGKTHMLCHTAEQEIKQGRVYLFFGTEFELGKDAIHVICDILGWELEDMGRLNSKLEKSSNYATFIIDAINEGVGTDYWKEEIPKLVSTIKKYPQLKLAVSVRRMESTSDIVQLIKEWPDIQLDGFEHPNLALRKYFDAYGISSEATVKQIPEFTNPLFLSIYCKSFSFLGQKEQNTPNILNIYLAHLKSKNKAICKWVDEDNHQSITAEFLQRLAATSVNDNHGGDLGREYVRRLGNRVCRYRPWSKSLLHAMLKENLLFEYSNGNQDWITFEYDSMGDYLKADYILRRYQSDIAVLDYIKRGLNFFKGKAEDANAIHFQNLVIVLLSIWKPDTNVWIKPDFQRGGMLERYFLNSLYYSTEIEEQRLEAAVKLIEQHNRIYDPFFLLKNLYYIENTVLDKALNSLSKMSMSERDLKWTAKVNEVYDNYGMMDFKALLYENDFTEKKAQLVCWLLCSSYPIVRELMVRVLKKHLDSHISFIIPLLESFKNVDDPYIIQGLLSAVYGVLLGKRDVNLSLDVARKISEIYYESIDGIPNDIVIRRWSMLIVQFASSLSATYDGWKKLKELLKIHQQVTDVDFHVDENMEKQTYFGTTPGAEKIYTSLFGGDFALYVIGTNSSVVSRIFHDAQNDGIKLGDIQCLCAYTIKEEFGWSDELGEIDSYIFDDGGRFNHKRERIGKKYQWLAYFKVLAILSDSCKMKVNVYSSDEYEAKINYPWYAGYNNHFDPTLSYDLENENKSLELFEQSFVELDLTDEMLDESWFNDDNCKPTLNFILRDKDNAEWVVLDGYDSLNSMGNEQYSMFVHYESFFANKGSKDKISEFVKEIPFSDPTFSVGCIDFLWNEYPWADTYKSLNYFQAEEINGIKFWRTTISQLQEELGATESPQNSLIDNSPNEDVMRVLKLHTAERGIIRDADGNIAAMNIQTLARRLNVFIIKRSYLNKYLDEVGKDLFNQITGNKEHSIKFAYLSDKHYEGRYLYDSEHDPKVIREWGLVKPATDQTDRKFRIDSAPFGDFPYDTRDIISLISSKQK